MIHLLLFLIIFLISGSFFFIAKTANQKQENIVKKKIPDVFPQLFLRVLAAVIGFGEFYLLKYLQKVLFITPQNGYDFSQGVNIFCAIGIIITMLYLTMCLDHIFFPSNANTKRISPYSFHLGFKIRPVSMTVAIFISTSIVLFSILNYTYYKTGGIFVIQENMGFSTKQYTKSEISSVNLNTYQGKGNTFTDLIITFSDDRIVTTSADGEGAKLFLFEWHGQIQRTNNQP